MTKRSLLLRYDLLEAVCASGYDATGASFGGLVFPAGAATLRPKKQLMN